jgi:hypothetical protein
MTEQQKQIIKKRLQTTMIGAIYEFEENFGYLWGMDKDENEPLTDKEQRFLGQWEDARNRILNKGNNQLRQCLGELEKSQGQVKYNYRFKKGKDNNEN